MLNLFPCCALDIGIINMRGRVSQRLDPDKPISRHPGGTAREVAVAARPG